jgi:pteridine reductase
VTPPSRVALVTGAGRRVGQTIALALARHGCTVAVHYNGAAAGAQATVEHIRALAGQAEAFAADLSQPEAPAALVHAVVDRFARLDVLVNSAAVMLRTPFGEVTAADWDAMMAINLRAPFLLAQAAASPLRVARGCIVNLADHLAYNAEPDFVPHGISKGGIETMTRLLASRLAPDVRVNAVAPGAVLLPDGATAATVERLAQVTPLQRLGTPADVASAVCWLVDASYVTGEIVRVDGGRHLG